MRDECEGEFMGDLKTELAACKAISTKYELNAQEASERLQGVSEVQSELTEEGGVLKISERFVPAEKPSLGRVKFYGFFYEQSPEAQNICLGKTNGIMNRTHTFVYYDYALKNVCLEQISDTVQNQDGVVQVLDASRMFYCQDAEGDYSEAALTEKEKDTVHSVLLRTLYSRWTGYVEPQKK
jgi:hypothetical protein